MDNVSQPKPWARIVERLIETGNTVGENELVFANDPLIGNLLEGDGFAFLLAASIDRGMKAENAWRLPGRIRTVMGHLDVQRMSQMTPEEMLAVLHQIQGRPRYLTSAARTLVEVSQHVVTRHDGIARNLWRGQPAAIIKLRMTDIYGVGPGIAAMVVILLDKLGEIKLSPEDYVGMDPKPDVHVQRVFGRLGLCEGCPTERDVIQAARRVHPEYPGRLDSPAWHIGRTWCHAERPACSECPMAQVCPKVI